MIVELDRNLAHYADVIKTSLQVDCLLYTSKAAALAAEIHGVKKNALYKYGREQ